MGAKVVAIASAPEQGVIETLREMLELAESGKLLSVAVCGVDHNGNTHTSYAGCNRSGIRELSAATNLLNWKVAKLFSESAL